MVLSSSSTLGGKVASMESLDAAIEACRVVLHEVRRRVDATVTNTTTKSELRQGLRLADSALASASKASSHGSAGAHSVPPPPLSSTEERGAKMHGGRRSSTDHSHGHHGSGNNGARTASTGHDTPASSTPTPQAPPLPNKEDFLTRPTVSSPLLHDGQRQESPHGEGEDSGPEKRVSNTSLSGASDRGRADAASTVAGKSPLSTVETCFPLCTSAQTAALYGFVLGAVFWRRRKLTEYALSAIEALLGAVAIPQDLSCTLIVDPALLNGDNGSGAGGHGTAGDKRARRGGGGGHRRSGRITVAVSTAVYYTLDECLTQSSSEPSVQMRALRLLNALIVEGESVAATSPTSTTMTPPPAVRRTTKGVLFRADGAVEDVFHGQAAMRTIDACYAVAVDGVQEGVRHEARIVLRAAVIHVVCAFVTMRIYDDAGAGADGAASATTEQHATFATDTILTDYTVDVDHNEPFTPVRITPAGGAANASPSLQRLGGFPIVETASGKGAEPKRRSGAVDRSAARDGPMRESPTRGSAPTAAPTPAASSASPARHFGIDDEDGDDSSDGHAVRGAAAPIVYSPMNPAPSQGAPAVSFTTQQINPGSDSFVQSVPGSGSPQFTNLSFNPHLLFSSSIDDSLVTDALSTLNNADGALPSSLKDLLMLLRRMCRCAVRTCTGALSDANTDVRARDLSLWVLEITLAEFAVANCEQEHRCAVWMSLVMHACKYELLGCLAKNLAMPAPFSFFERAIHLLEMLLRKLHYHLARELHTLLGAFLLPLMVSRYATFRQKHAVLAMIRQIFAVPHLCVSFFVNYDCNPAFDAGAEYGGMLELLVEHVVEMTFIDQVNEDGDAYPWLTSDQQQLLRSECVVVIHTLMQSLHRWIAEDPQEYAQALQRSVRKAVQRRHQQQQGVGGATRERSPAVDEIAELYLDNWDADEVPVADLVNEGGSADTGDDATGVSNTESGAGALHTRNLTIVLEPASGSAVPHWGKNRNIEYHWKHIHYLLHDKRIAQEAVQRINAGNWQDAKTFLESRGYMAAIPPSEAQLHDPTAVEPGNSSFFLFARFLFDYPGVSRDSLSKIFERVNRKGGESRLVLMEYLHCFNYVDVPIDVAMRDTTCKFMSWDRPMFESKVWETIQKCFGAEYARQNPNAITADDADTMAGVLLFLHSNLHNKIVKNNRMPAAQFVRDANDCLALPLMEEDLQAMYHRVLGRKWELDLYGRTPQQAERERTLVRLSAKIHMGHAAQLRRQSGNVNANQANTSMANSGNNTSISGPDRASPPSLQRLHSPSTKDPAATDADTTALDEVLQRAESESTSCHSSFAANRSPITTSAPPPPAQNLNASLDASSFQIWLSNDVALLDSTIPSYTDSKDALKLKDEQHHAFLEVSALYLNKLESVHRLYCIEGEAYRPQPYIVPYYAEHVRQILLMAYPHVMSCVYMGFRILEEAPIARKLLDTLQVTYDIAAAFVLNLRDLRPVMEEVLQRYLDDERAYKLLPPSRATFVPVLMNIM